jgi:hypothetical protein
VIAEAVVAPPGELDREPAGVAFVERTEGAHVAFGHGEKQHLVARALSMPYLSRPGPGKDSPRGGNFVADRDDLCGRQVDTISQTWVSQPNPPPS